MPHVVSLDAAHGRCVVRVFGVDNAVGMRQCLLDIVEHPEWLPGMDIVIDFTDVEGTEANSVDMLEIADLHRQQRDRVGLGRMILVGVPPRHSQLEVTYSIARELGGGRGAKTFDTVAEALDFLDSQNAGTDVSQVAS